MINLSVPILGPFGWPKLENELIPLPSSTGVYLMAVAHKDGFLPYGVGITRRPMRKRFLEHTRSFTSGNYNILDLDAACEGVRKIAWKGWGWTPEKRADYEARKDTVVASAIRQLTATHIFIIELADLPRALERLEAAIANNYYSLEHTLVDRGMLLMPRRNIEESIMLSFQSQYVFYGLPSKLEI